MNKIIVAVVAAFAFSGIALAAPPDVMTFETKQGKVTLNHKAHGEKLKDCKACHVDEKGGKIPGWSKDKAHALCKKCHEDKKAGPTKCADCHKK